MAALSQRSFAFQCLYNGRAEPFKWQYTRDHLEAYIERLALQEEQFAEAASQLQLRRQEVAISENCLTH